MVLRAGIIAAPHVDKIKDITLGAAGLAGLIGMPSLSGGGTTEIDPNLPQVPTPGITENSNVEDKANTNVGETTTGSGGATPPSNFEPPKNDDNGDKNQDNEKNKEENNRTTPKNLDEQLALKEAQSGAGKPIMQGQINDPVYQGFNKMSYVHTNPDGSKIEIHYWKNIQTGVTEGFKFK